MWPQRSISLTVCVCIYINIYLNKYKYTVFTCISKCIFQPNSNSIPNPNTGNWSCDPRYVSFYRCMYVYIYIYIFINIYVYTYIHINKYAYLCIYLNVFPNPNTGNWSCDPRYVSFYRCMYVYIYIYV
jgi:hypothetical protein